MLRPAATVWGIRVARFFIPELKLLLFCDIPLQRAHRSHSVTVAPAGFLSSAHANAPRASAGQHRAELELRAMDTHSLVHLQHRCGTCGKILPSIEELREHLQACPIDERSESAGVNGVRYARDNYAHSVEISLWLVHGRAGKSSPPDVS
jgi:hypothetical protein